MCIHGARDVCACMALMMHARACNASVVEGRQALRAPRMLCFSRGCGRRHQPWGVAAAPPPGPGGVVAAVNIQKLRYLPPSAAYFDGADDAAHANCGGKARIGSHGAALVPAAGKLALRDHGTLALRNTTRGMGGVLVLLILLIILLTLLLPLLSLLLFLVFLVLSLSLFRNPFS